MDSEIDQIIAALARHDIEVTVLDNLARVEVDGRVLERQWVTKVDYPLPGNDPVLVLGSDVPPRLIATIRANGDWYADVRGNTYIAAPGVRVDIRGQRPPQTPARKPPAKNLFSPRRAQVVFCLLTWPELLHASARTVARAAGVSPAITIQTGRALQEEGYAYPGARRLDRHDELLDRWAESFPLGLGRDLALGHFVGQTNPHAWTKAGIPVYLSGESAAPGIQGTTLTMYVPKISVPAVIGSRWRAPRADEEPAITVRRAFWEDPHRTSTTEPGVENAPALLIYADLLSSRDSRQREVALAMRETLRDLD